MQACSLGGLEQTHSRPPSTRAAHGKMPRLLLLLLLMVGGVAAAGDADSVLSTTPSTPEPTCLMRGVCGEVRFGSKDRIAIPCTGPFVPQQMEKNSTRALLAEYCPMFKEHEALCCDDANVEALVANFILATPVLGNCEVCFRNFRDLWCQYTCSPRQSQFVHFPPNSTRQLPVIQGVEKIGDFKNGTMVDRVEFHVNSTYIRDIFKSCMKVHMLSQYSLGVVCQMPDTCIKENPTDECIQECLKFLGTAQSKTRQPLTIDFVIDKTQTNPASLTSDEPLQKCHDTSDEYDACSCHECFKACPATPKFLEEWERRWTVERKGQKYKKPEKPSPSGTNASEATSEGVEVTKTTSTISSSLDWISSKSFIYEYPWYGVISFIIGCLLGYAVIGWFLYRDNRRKTETDAKEIVKFAGTYWGARDLLDNAQRGGANWYAKVAADRAGLIFTITCATVAIFCIFGIPMQELISDPINVWTQAGSRARIEKDNFENYFGPTPRYTQVIIKPIHTYTRPFHYGHKNYGPIFHHFVLQQAFKLTQSLLDLRGRGVDPVTGKKVVVNLTDVCYKMVDDHCFVMSPMSYFQNNRSILECVDGGCSPEFDEAMKQHIIAGKGVGPEQGIQSFLQIFPNGTERIIPGEKEEKKKGGGDEDVFEDDVFEDYSMRKKREVPVHEHRVRAKRNHPIDAPTAKNDSQYEERRSQEELMNRGFGLLKHMISCIEIPVGTSAYLDLKCGSQMGGAPVPGNLVFGEWYKNAPANLPELKKIIHYSSAYLITIGLDARKRDMAEIWEKEVINMLKKFSSEYVEVSFITQYSIQDEIDKSSREDVKIIAIGYVLMAIYIVFGLSQFSVDSPKGIIKHTLVHQFIPGAMVSLTITLSVLFVMAFYGMIGVSATLMCLEVQPFLLCAIGVNNIFYFVKTYQRKMYERRQLEAALFPGPPNESFVGIKNVDSSEDENDESLNSEEERRAREMVEMEDCIRRDVLTQTCQRVLPSMFCTAFTECVCFLSLGLSSAPVLKVFSWYASAGVIVNFFFTLTIFVPAYIMAMKYSASPSEICSPIDCVPRAKKGLRRRGRRRFDAIRSSRGWMPHLLEKYYAPYLFTKKGRYTSVILQALMITISIVFIPQLKIGLDEKMSVPKASYVHKFMSILPDTLATSMPVHFVVHSKSGRPLDVGNEKFVKLFCTDRAECDKESLGNLIGHAVRVTQTDLISQPAMNWFDDYRKYRSVSKAKSCCLRDEGEEGQYCTVEEVNEWTVPQKNCSSCLANKENPFANMTRDLKHFTVHLPTRDCATSGGMAHREAINFTAKGEVNAFYLRSFHRTFRNSSDFIEGLRISRDVCDEFRKVLDRNDYQDIEVYPFSFYYLFYDQYLYIAMSTSSQLALSAGIAFIGLTLTTVSPTTAVIVAMNTLSSTLLLVAYMVFNGIELNALTIVNLAMSLGIGLEFSVHLCFAYANSGRVDRIGRATDALVNVGSTVFSGIVFTKFLGIIVLYNAQSQIFGFYYFDFYVGLLPIGVCHGFVFLPVMLTFWGPDTYLRRYVEQNDKASLTGGDQQGSEEGRPDSMSSPRSMAMASAPTSKASSRGPPPSYGRMAAAISPATIQMNAHDHGSNGNMSSVRRQSSSPCLATAASTIDHENAPLVVREDSLRSNDGSEAV